MVDDSFLLCFNVHDDVQDFVTPQGDYAEQWTAALDTADATGTTELVVERRGKDLAASAHSLLVLRKTA